MGKHRLFVLQTFGDAPWANHLGREKGSLLQLVLLTDPQVLNTEQLSQNTEAE